ncbi:hypothetical protein TB2_013217 [Malus domestica]
MLLEVVYIRSDLSSSLCLTCAQQLWRLGRTAGGFSLTCFHSISGAGWLLDAPVTAPSFTGTPMTPSDGCLRAQNAPHRLSSRSSGDLFEDKDIAFSQEHLKNDCRFQSKNNKSWKIQAFTNSSYGEDCDGGVKTLKQQPLP